MSVFLMQPSLNSYGASGGPEMRLQGYSPIMNPTNNHQVAVLVGARNPNGSQGLELQVIMEVLGPGLVRHHLVHRIWTPDDLADAYELAHHQVHGHDPRGLDPTTGPTRLEPPWARR